ncbi:MAG: argininosuccinate lyase [Acidimicrobiia bacterium]|nr:argininosuccinate lyase [Acidimicrobiia bacterium]
MTGTPATGGRDAQMWGGRFSEGPHRILWDFTVDHSDRRLLRDDLTGSLAHVAMLGEAGLLSNEEVATLTEGLQEIVTEADGNTFRFLESDEDVHSAVERRLGELVGEVAGKLHTGRSRNDQVALDLRLYLLRSAGARIDDLRRFCLAMMEAAEEAGDTVVAGYTHLQQAQAVPLAHHLLAYVSTALRDIERFEDLGRRLDVSPLGAGALGGSSLPLDPDRSAELLGMGGRFMNSMDAVAARDHVSEYAFACTQALVHLSRLATECVLWTTTEFGWVTFSDALTTGSSAMPHKKNPDIAELARGRTATAIGYLTGLMALQKGLPMTYNRDLQEDKAALFAIDDALAGALVAMTALIGSADFHPPAPDPSVTALDLAEALVERGVPFRDAHHAVGALLAALSAAGKALPEATIADLVEIDPRFEPSDLSLTDPVGSVRRRRSTGGAGFASVREQLRILEHRLG